MPSRRCVVVDYKMGNTWSVKSAIQHLGVEAVITNDPDEISAASHVVLPGVGSFSKAMTYLETSGLADSLKDFVRVGGGHLLGICLGMQLLAVSGTEHGNSQGLGLIPLQVDRFAFAPAESLPLPHVGFNSVNFTETVGLFADLKSVCDFYFVHSYRMVPPSSAFRGGVSRYGETFLSAIEYANVAGTQFHPEKSQANGLMLLKNFLSKN